MIKLLRCAAFAATLAFSLSLHAVTFLVNPTLDAFVTPGGSGTFAANNYGGAGALAVSAASLAQGEFQSVLQFNVAAAKSSFDAQYGTGGWTVQSVTLSLTAAAPNNAIFNSSAAGGFNIAWMQNDSWTEGTGTPALPTTAGITFSTLSNFVSGADQSLGTFSSSGATSGSLSYNLNVPSSFNSDLLAGGAVSLRLFAADAALSFTTDSRNFGTASARPLLTITAVPEPASIAFASLAMSLVFGRRLRRH
jgi:hypothetical protein